MSCAKRRVLAVVTSWEDVENLNLILTRLIDSAESSGIPPMCVSFTRNTLESRGGESLREFMSMFDVPDMAGFLLLGEMIRSDAINERIIRTAREKGLPVFMLERRYEGCINLAFDYPHGFESVARHMAEDHGCRNIVMVAGIQGNPFSEERIGLLRDNRSSSAAAAVFQ